MKRNLFYFLKSFDMLEIRNIKDFEALETKLEMYKTRIEKNKETIENRLKINMIINMQKAMQKEKLIFKTASNNNGKNKQTR